MFSTTIREIRPHEPLFLTEEATFRDAVQAIRQGKKGAVAILRGKNAVGIVTERDVVRLLAKGTAPETPVTAI